MKPYIVIDCETDGLDPNTAKIECVEFSCNVELNFNNCFDLYKLKTLLKDPQVMVIGHNVKFDVHVLERAGYEVNGELYDTMVAEYVINPDKPSLGLKSLAKEYNLAENILTYKELQEKFKVKEPFINAKGKKKTRTVINIPQTVLSEYCKKDVMMTEKLYLRQQEVLKEKDPHGIFWRAEFPLTRILYNMEKTGVKINIEECHRQAKEIRDFQAEVVKKITEIAGTSINIRSPKQLRQLLYVDLGIMPPVKTTTKTNQYSTDLKTLTSLIGVHPIIELLVKFKKVEKIASTYFEAYPKNCDASGRVHTTFNQATVETGRLSSSGSVNLQNVPEEARGVFITDPDWVLLDADFNQLEVRIISVVAKDVAMQTALRDGVDLHTLTTSEALSKPFEQVTKEERSKIGKVLNFGMNYGMTEYGLADKLGKSKQDALVIRDKHLKFYSGVANYIRYYPDLCRRLGYTETVCGRRRYVKDLKAKMESKDGAKGIFYKINRCLINTPIQGSASDFTKLAMIRLDKMFKRFNMKARIILQVHDEILVECPKEESKAAQVLMKASMESLSEFGIRLYTEVGESLNWKEAKV